LFVSDAVGGSNWAFTLRLNLKLLEKEHMCSGAASVSWVKPPIIANANACYPGVCYVAKG
jgi:hypothetical protein